MKLVEYPDQDMMMIDLANVLAGAVENVLLHEDTASLVVPGGTTPGPIFDYLSAADLDWSRVQVMLSDERWVPESSPRSNTRLLKQRLLVGRAANANYLPLYADAETPEEKLAELAGAITPYLPISVMLLGMGTDMHTASLFPSADRLAEAMDAHAPTLMAMRAPGAAEPRVTLTAPVLAGALAKHIVITGAEKRAALERARHMSDPMVAPISAVLRGATVH
ncbi:MAG: 6-phosphogluconolactonase, partial [Paracoccaceae bacterium]